MKTKLNYTVTNEDALSKFTKELEKSSEVKKAAKHYKKSVKDVVKILASRFKLTRYSDKSVKSISINFKDNPSNITFNLSHSYKQNESVTY